MRILCAVLLALPICLQAQDWSLERLFSRPYVWGAPPSSLGWSKRGGALAFLWNAEGNRFKDLYVYNTSTGKRVRLTDLEHQKDELLLTEDEKDERLKQYLLPQAGLNGYAISDDGSRVAFVFKGDLYLVNTDGGSAPFRLTRTKPPEANPQFSPDGKSLAYVRGGQIQIQNLTNGQLWQVTDIEASAGNLTTYRWSPDGKRFVYGVRKGQGRMQVLPNYSGRLVSARQFSRDVAGDEPEEATFFVIAAEGGKPVQLEAGTMGKTWSSFPEWSPDSTRLLTHPVSADQKKRQIVVDDPKTGKGTVIFESTDPRWVENEFAHWSPDSSAILFLHDGDGFNHLYRISAAGGKPTQLTSGKWEIHTDTFSEPPQWTAKGITYSSTEPGPSQRFFYRIATDGSGKEALSARPGLNIGYVSDDGQHTALMLADLDHPLDLWVDGKRVTESARPEFEQYKWPKTRFYTFPSKTDGQTVAAKMLLPEGYDPNRKGKLWPAVFFVHGAGFATSVLQQWGSYNDVRYAYNCYLAHKGYVVFDIDYRGSSGYGRDWRTGIYLDMGGPDLDDILGGVEYARKLGNIDMKRIGIWGVSYGGFMTDMALFRAPGVFRAGAAWAAVNDWENYNAGYTEQRLNKPSTNPEAYRRSSPIWFSNQLRDHLLIVHGMVDDNVLFQDAVQLTEKLIQEHKQFEHIYYPEESHGFLRDETWIDAFRRTTEWFDRWLQ